MAMTDVLRLDDQLCFALHAASRAMTGAYQPLLEERRRGLDVAGRSNPHDFPASRFRIVYMLQDVRRVDEVE